MMHEHKDKLSRIGYVIIKNFISLDFVKLIKEDIFNAKKTINYKDRSGNLRRIEKLYDKGENLIELNNKITKFLNKIFDEDFIIFKDKYNAKPPGGEGFYAHYDGIFNWIDSSGKKRNGWYEYADYFINSLLAIDNCDANNGTIQLSKIHDDTFENLLKRTKENGTPDLKINEENKCYFESITLNQGDLLIFSNKCPHRSFKNNSKTHRMTLYYTYNKLKDGDNYLKYFQDKIKSKNLTSKSLSGQI